MQTRDLKILAIDDNRDNLTALKAVLSERLSGARLLNALNGPKGLDLARAEDPDVILLDIVMPGMDGYAVCRELKADVRLHAIPVLFVTALRSDRNSRITALEAGAEGFLTKPFDEVELTAQIRAMAKIKAMNRLQRMEKEQLAALVDERTRALEQELSERRRAEEALRVSEQRYRSLADTMPDIIWQLDLDLRIVYANSAIERVLGYNTDEFIGRSLADFCSAERLHQMEQVIAREIQNLERHAGVVFETEMIHRSGQAVPVEVHGMVLRDESGKATGFQGVTRNITDRIRAEEEREKLQLQLLQAQKLESVGRLAGGVAHDFNNMLGVIAGYAELSLQAVGTNDPLHGNLKEILGAASRSTQITRQLLAFARQQAIRPKVLDLNETVESMLKMLRRLIGEDKDVAWLPGGGLWPVEIDPSQIDQILANLCVNARDAIAEVGKITIETDRVSFDRASCAGHPDRVPGDYVLLAVSDDGCGMAPEILDKIFEPFFTTKEPGQGTGLGLATVYGIVKQNNGFIDVYSEPGQGTTFRIYLPRFRGQAGRAQTDGTAEPLVRGQETILLVEDEPAILKLTTEMLDRQGYTVLAASKPSEAIRLAGAHPGEIHLLMTDVVMPEMNGRDLAAHLMPLHPHLRRLFMSGYTASVIVHHGVLEPGIHLIAKPFSMKELAHKVREALDGK